MFNYFKKKRRKEIIKLTMKGITLKQIAFDIDVSKKFKIRKRLKIEAIKMYAESINRAEIMIFDFLSKGHKIEDIAKGISHEKKQLYSDTLQFVAKGMLKK